MEKRFEPFGCNGYGFTHRLVSLPYCNPVLLSIFILPFISAPFLPYLPYWAGFAAARVHL
jgi:hypothetical protein